jgi:uncharacterized protein YjbJ (UPF0337 family)
LKANGRKCEARSKNGGANFTDDELEQAGGKADQLIGLLQQKYGYTREQAEEEFDRRLKEAEAG